MRTACRGDFQRLCAEIGGNASRGEVFRCLASHEDEVSDGCRVALGEERDGADGALDAPPVPPDAGPRPRPPAP